MQGIYPAVVKRIRQLCEDKKITPNALSYASGISQSTVKSIMNGESTNPGIVTIKKLCDGFGITITEFFDTEEFRNLEQELH
ncbi:MAG: helix-turn-helix domain-containing protein [Butyrivibrio sp.]